MPIDELDLDKLEDYARQAKHRNTAFVCAENEAFALIKAARELTECRRAYPVIADAYNRSALEVDALRAKIMEARKALEPFAEGADKIAPSEPDDCWADSLLVGDLRAARAALASLRDS